MKDPKTSVSTWLRLFYKAARFHNHETQWNVPCNGCTACCRTGHAVILAQGDSITLANDVDEAGAPIIKPNEDGACPHLTDSGCSCHDDKPRQCRQFDCRIYAFAGIKTGKEGMDEAIAAWDVERSIKTAQDRQDLAAMRLAVMAGREHGMTTDAQLLAEAIKRRAFFASTARAAIRHGMFREG